MTSSRLTVLLMSAAIALFAVACENQATILSRMINIGTRPSMDAAAEPSAQSLPRERDRPATKLTIVMLDGQQAEVELELFNPIGFPLTFYTPVGVFTRELQSSAEGLRAQLSYQSDATAFTDPPRQTYVSLTIPDEELTIDELRDRIVGETGLMVRQQWQMVDRTRVLTYSWAIERIDFQSTVAGQVYLGSIVLGDRDGQLFYTVTHYPQALRQEFLPLASLILETIEHRQLSP